MCLLAYVHLQFTFTEGGESESFDTELPLRLLFCLLLLSCGGGEGATCKSQLSDTADGSPSVSLACQLLPPLENLYLLTLGRGLDSRASFTVFGSRLKSSESCCFTAAMLILLSFSLKPTHSVRSG